MFCFIYFLVLQFFIKSAFLKDQVDDDNLIDWSDNQLFEYEKGRIGLGEQGEAADLGKIGLLDFQKGKLFVENGFNAALSDRISLNRSLYDFRHNNCLTKKYSQNLPKASVVIPFYNEHLSTLLRSVYSILNRTPKPLLVEIILVDDCSTKGDP